MSECQCIVCKRVEEANAVHREEVKRFHEARERIAIEQGGRIREPRPDHNRDRKATVYVAGEAVAVGQLVAVRIPEADEPKKPEPPAFLLFCDTCGKKIPGSWASMGDRCGDLLVGKLHCDGKLGIQKPKPAEDLGLTYPAEALRAARRSVVVAICALARDRAEEHRAAWTKHCEPQDDGAADALNRLADDIEEWHPLVQKEPKS